MANTLTKSKMGRGDTVQYDGVSLTTTRSDGAGSSVTVVKMDDAVDVLMVYGSGTNRTSAVLQTALNAVGSSNVALSFAPGTWTISANVTVPSNVTMIVPAGCVFSVNNGITLTVQGVFFRQHATYSSGDGTVDVSGATDVLATASYSFGYAADTGTANNYAIAPSPAITSYTAGDTFRMKVLNTNTGASTLAVSGLAAKNIRQADGATALSAGDLTAGQIAQVMYESGDDEFHLVPTGGGGASITTRGDAIRGSSSGNAERLALGSAGEALVSDGTDLLWGAPYGIVQIVSAVDAAYQNTSTTIPADDTIPQNTEGVELVTVAITPNHASNRLLILANAYVNCSESGTSCAALFQDSTADALAAHPEHFVSGQGFSNLEVMHEMAAGTTSSTTLKMRVGPSAGTMYINGTSGGRFYGGVGNAQITIIEVRSNG